MSLLCLSLEAPHPSRGFMSCHLPWEAIHLPPPHHLVVTCEHICLSLSMAKLHSLRTSLHSSSASSKSLVHKREIKLWVAFPFKQERWVQLSLVRTQSDQQRAQEPLKMQKKGVKPPHEQDFLEILLASNTFIIVIFLSYSFPLTIPCRICHLAAAKACKGSGLGKLPESQGCSPLVQSTFQQLERI